MNQKEKNELLSKAQRHVTEIRSYLSDLLLKLKEKASDQTYKQILKMGGVFQMTAMAHYKLDVSRYEETKQINSSPYFVKCKVLFDDKKTPEVIYFGKFSLNEKSIYSWITPAATIRFESPGKFNYTKPNGAKRNGTLITKDQYMIVDGKIIFLATESINNQRELIYQEHFSTQKTSFVLPEIVAQMEKAQDQVIRANYKGSFVISGPAGSGKTTLALHRVAYLVQSPDTTKLFPKESILVIVQDTGTKDYFSHLLPELGITEVSISTFSEWAFKILEIKDAVFINSMSSSAEIQDQYEHAKIKALQNLKISKKYSSNYFQLLQDIYQEFFSTEQKELFTQQIKKLLLDRIDLTVLLELFKNIDDTLTKTEIEYIDLGKGKFRRKYNKVKVLHSLLILDEFQNYLPEQINLLKSTLDPRTDSLVYVGDMAQQVRLGTIQNWNQVNEFIDPERNVTLKKVYRNTQEILQYIKQLGYKIEIVKEAKKGTPVIEKICTSPQMEIDYVKNIITSDPKASIGILSISKQYLEAFEKVFKDLPTIHILTMEEAQGVEFEKVILVGVNKDLIRVQYDQPEKLVEEKIRINKDRLYVALTRAISELHILGKEKLSTICKTYYNESHVTKSP